MNRDDSVIIKFQTEIRDCIHCPYHSEIEQTSNVRALSYWCSTEIVCTKLRRILDKDYRNADNKYTIVIPPDCPFRK